MRIGGGCRTIYRIAPSVGTHIHGTHAIGHTTINRLQITVVKGILPHHGDQCINGFLIGYLAVLLQAVGCILIILTAQSHHRVGNTALKPVIFILTTNLEGVKLGQAALLQTIGLFPQTCSLFMVKWAHVCLGHRGDCTQYALLPTPRTSSITRNQSLIVAPHHQMIAQGCFAGSLWTIIIIQAKKFLVGIGQQTTEYLGSCEVRIKLRGLLCHAQCIVVAAHLHALATTLTKVTDENRKDASIPWVLLLNTSINSRNVVICQWKLVYNVEKLFS